MTLYIFGRPLIDKKYIDVSFQIKGILREAEVKGHQNILEPHKLHDDSGRGAK
jgi:hypothetical protein